MTPSAPASPRAERARVRALAAEVDAARLALAKGLAARGADPPDLDEQVAALLGELLLRWCDGRLTPAGLPAALRAAGLACAPGQPRPLVTLLERAPSPALAARLAQAHEHTLTRRLQRRGGRVALVPSAGRRRRGVYYTPPDVVSFIVEETLGALLSAWEAELPRAGPARCAELLERARELAVLDPACGAGAFLLGALAQLRGFYQRLAERMGSAAPRCLLAPGRLAVARNLYGVDLDGRALGLAELALRAAVRDEPGRTPRLVGRSLRRGDHLGQDGFAHRRAFRRVFARPDPGFDVVVGNPPYAPLTPAQTRAAAAAGYRAHDARDLYALFVEGSLRLSRDAGRGGLIVPLSLVFSRATRSLREELLASERPWRLASFDRIPSGLFEAEVRTRTTIALMGPRQAGRPAEVATGRLLRFTAAERPRVFSRLELFSASGLHHPELGLPKLGSAVQARWLRRLLSGERGRLGDAVRGDGPQRLFFKQNCYGFAIVTAELPPAWDAAGDPAPQTKYSSLGFAAADERDAALALLAGRWLFWWWLTYGDGFDVTAGLLEAFPVDPLRLPAPAQQQLARLGRSIQRAAKRQVATKRNGGKTIGTFDLRACRRLTDRADALVADALGAEELLADIAQQLSQTHGAG